MPATTPASLRKIKAQASAARQTWQGNRMEQMPMNRRKRHAALAITGLAFLLAMAVMAWLINSYDWGVALMLAAPFVVYALIRLARRLDAWAQDEPQ